MIFEEDLLEHSGVKGMKWGVRKDRPTGSTSNVKRNAKIVLGSAALAAALGVGAYYAKKHMNVSLSDMPDPSESVKLFAKSMAEEPKGIVHAARGKNTGFTFPGRGGLTEPLHEYDNAKFSDANVPQYKRYGNNSEKVAARFRDPEERNDFAGRPIFHDVMLPKDLAVGVNTVEDAAKVAWPLIRDTYAALYNRER